MEATNLAWYMIRAHKLQDHLNKDKIPDRYALVQDREAGFESQEFLDWEKQDHLLGSWLLASIEIDFSNRMVGCECICLSGLESRG